MCVCVCVGGIKGGVDFGEEGRSLFYGITDGLKFG